MSVSIRALKGKRLELSTPNVHMYPTAGPQQALTLRSKVQSSR